MVTSKRCKIPRMALDFGQAGESLANYQRMPVNKHSTLDVNCGLLILK